MGVRLDVDLEFDAEVLDSLLRSSPRRQSEFLRRLAGEIVNDIKESFGTSSGYRTYKRGNVTHTSSRPGEPPNVDTGALRASIHWEEEAPGTVHVMDGVEYGAHLELGTENMAARPFMGPAIERAVQNLADFARDEGLLEP